MEHFDTLTIAGWCGVRSWQFASTNSWQSKQSAPTFVSTMSKKWSIEAVHMYTNNRKLEVCIFFLFISLILHIMS